MRAEAEEEQQAQCLVKNSTITRVKIKFGNTKSRNWTQSKKGVNGGSSQKLL